MKPITKIAITSIAITLFTACGGGGSATAPAASTSDTSTVTGNVSATPITASSDGEGAAIAVITGGNQASGSVQSASTTGTKGAAAPSNDQNATNLVLSRIAERGRDLFQSDDTTSTTEKAISVSQTATTIIVNFDNEVITYGSGSLTFNGPVTFTKTSNTTFTAAANVSGKYTNLQVSPTVRGRVFNETINGTITLGINADYALIYNSLGKLVRIDADGTVELTGSQIQFTGTANGTITSMSPSVHAIISFYPTSYDYIATCSGSVSVTIGSTSGTCSLSSTCDGCQ
jgi:hypothetical protein